MDWIDTLPEGVVCHILSFLPTKQAALTSVLSKRWHHLWTLIPNLDIDNSVFLHPEDGKGERDTIRKSFVDFVDRVLTLQGDSPIEKFSLKCITGVHPDTVNRWICNVLKRGVSDLNLFIDFSDEDTEDDDYRLPMEMFVSRTLVKLRIRSEHCVDWWHWHLGPCLPMLKSLYIDSEMIFFGEMERFLLSLPALEELRMANMEWPELDETMSSESLRKLSIHGTGSEEFEHPKSISFDTPNLLYLNYSDLVAEDYPLVKMGKLFQARINLIVKNEDQIKRIREPDNGLLEDDEGDDVVVLKFGNVVKLMIGIQNIQQLYLNSDTLEVLSLCCESMPVFNNLKILGIKSDEGRGWQAMPALLRNCPQIEFLFIEGLLHFVTDKCGDACDCISREDKGRSLISCPVKKLQVRGFRGTIREKNMIRHFLEFCPCLDEMEIDAEENDSTNIQVPKILKILAYKLHDVVSTEIVGHWQSSVRSGVWSQTQMDEIYYELAPRNKERIYDMVFIMHGASSSVPAPLSQEMSQDYLQMQLDAANAELADLKEKKRDQEAQLAGFEAKFDMIVDQNPMIASALRAREATESERAKASGQQMTEKKKRNYDALFDIIAEQNPMLAPALRAQRATNSERAETSRSRDQEMTELDQATAADLPQRDNKLVK